MTLQVSSEPGNQYNVSLMNALVLYVGTQAIAYIHSKERTPSTGTIAHTAHMDIFQHLVVDLDTEGGFIDFCYHGNLSVCFFRSLFVPQCHCQSAPLSEQPHSLFQLCLAVSVCWNQCWSNPRADHPCIAGETHREQTTPLGVTHHFHWADQESLLQFLDTWVCALCTGNWKVSLAADIQL